jgi:uncharacterized protein DUF5670
MLGLIILVLLLLWFCGFTLHVGGGMIHLLLMVVVIVILVELLSGRRGL